MFIIKVRQTLCKENYNINYGWSDCRNVEQSVNQNVEWRDG